MFVARTRFPVKLSIVYVLQKLYGMNVRKFKYKNAILILDFLLACKEKKISYRSFQGSKFPADNRSLQIHTTFIWKDF